MVSSRRRSASVRARAIAASSIVLSSIVLPLGPLAGFAHAQEPLCSVDVSLEPERAVVGQQLRYRARIVRRAEVDDVAWLRAPTFPDFRAQWLPGRPESRVGPDDAPARYQRDELRAVFPARAGRLAIPEAVLRCRSGARLEETTLPGSFVDVDEPPSEGRPGDWSGAVGRMIARAHLDRDSIALGESVRLSFSLRGSGNLWVSSPPIDGRSLGSGVEVFAEPARLDIEAGERAQVRRTFRYELVPRDTGRFTIPAIRFPTFDPETGRYDVTETTPMQFEVAGRSARGADAIVHGTPDPTGSGDDGDRSDWKRWALLTLALMAAIGWAWSIRSDPSDGVGEALDEADRAVARDEAELAARLLERALRGALARRDPTIADHSASALVVAADADPAIAPAVELLERLERLRFGGTGETPAVDSVRAVVTELPRRRG